MSFDKCVTAIQWRKDSLFNNCARAIEHPYAKKKKMLVFMHAYINFSSVVFKLFKVVIYFSRNIFVFKKVHHIDSLSVFVQLTHCRPSFSR